MAREGFPFKTTLRVRYEETDAQKVVYYANYFTYMEVARWEYVTHLAWSREEARDFWERTFVVEASCAFKSPARFDDVLELYCRIAEIRRSSFVVEYEFYEQESQCLVASGRTIHVFMDPLGSRPQRVPEEFRARVAAVEGKTGKPEGTKGD